jgi:putative spermidine/putrescine transport system substrate-binding protein
MVEAKHVTWDVVEVESGDIGRGCQEGLYERLDASALLAPQDLLPAAVNECGIGAFVWSTVLAYNADLVKTAPSSWKAFWDVKTYPGKRGMRKGARYNLEFALMADGVPAADVYKMLATPAGVDRAFRKLDELKPYIQWWEAGSQPPQFLVAGDVVMSTAYNGRIDAAQREGKNLRVVFSAGNIYDIDYWVIPKGAPNKATALEFIQFASSADAQVAYSQEIAYGPTNLKALKRLEAATLANLPTAPENMKNAVQHNLEFWTDYGDELDRRFAVWAAK